MDLRGFVILAAVYAAAIAAERWLPPPGSHGKAWWSHIPGFYALFGAFVCLAIVLAAKLLVKLGLQRQESYYDEHH